MLELLLKQSVAAWQAGQLDKAENLAHAVLQMAPENFDGIHLLALLAAERGRHEQAVQRLHHALTLHPHEPNALLNLASSLRSLGRLDEALTNLNHALRLAPGVAAVHHNLGNVLREKGRLDEAQASFDRALKLAPADPDCHASRANVLFAKGFYTEARAGYTEALKLQSKHADASWNLSLLQLLHGELPEGWAGYEAGGVIGTRDIRRNFGSPVWHGEALTGKRILIHAEQGLGDTLQFCRYVKMVKEAGATEVLLEVQSPLLGIMSGLEGADQIFARGTKLPAFDLSCPLLSLPGIFATSLQNVPPPATFCLPEAHRERARVKITDTKSPRIGLICAGNPEHTNDAQRSIPLRDFAPLLNSGLPLQWIGLHKTWRASDAEALKTFDMLQDTSSLLQDIADTAAIVNELDLIITVDTAVAHLASSLGKPTWILLPTVPDWRWLLNRNDSPWYPSARLFRKTAGEDWHSLLSERVLPALISQFKLETL